ncbi:MAG TPA: response regulator, partial [Agromyces sp.]|nr:response regulator [Agromyces sp.]
MNDARPLRVAIADDALLLREGIAKVLEGGGIDVVASVGTGDELLEVVQGGGIDAAVLDIRMPPSYRDEGIVALESMRANGSTVG